MTEREVRAPRRSRASVIFFSLFGAVLVLAVVSIVLGFRYEDAMRREIAQSHDTHDHIQALFSRIQEAETSQRGFLLTQDPQDLRFYDTALRQIATERAMVASKIEADPALRANFLDLQQAIDAKLKTLAQVLTVNTERGPRVAASLLDVGQDANAMGRVRRQIAALSAYEEQQLAKRGDKAARFRLERNATVLGGVLVVAVVMALVLWRDERQRASQTALLARLEESAERQATIFNSAMDAIITLNPSGSIETINAAGLRLFGYSEAELLRRDISLLIDIAADAPSPFVDRLSTPGDLGKGYVQALTAKHRSGAAISVDVGLSAMTLSDGVHLVAMVRDASERRDLEALQDSFIATVSHELRTPLTSIAGSLGLLKGGAGGGLPPRALRLVEIAQANSARLVRLINDILDIEKIRSDSAMFDRKPLQIKELAQTACEAMGGFSFEQAVDLIVEPIDPGLWILGDHDRMMQVMSNLVSNAIKVSPAGGKVRISSETRGAMVRLAVTDEGPGVPEAFRDKIFTPFAQANQTDGRDLGGTGLGLSIVREIVERHDGVAGFDTRPGAGARFFFDVPMIEPPGDSLEPAQPAQPRILICEDDALIAEVLRDQLEGFGWDGDIVNTANEARHALHTGRYDAMLLDIRLPDSDGVTLMQALRAAPHTADLPIIAMSGSSEHKAQAEELGLIDWLEKPIRLSRLQQAVKTALRARESASFSILHVDDDPDLAEIARARLGGLGRIVSSSSLAAARAALAERAPDLVILDLGLPDGGGEALLDDLRRLPSGGPPTILYTAQDLKGPPQPPIRAVLIKSRSDLTQLARVAHKLLDAAAE